MFHNSRRPVVIKKTKDGMLNKGKIHCSCRMCRKKSYDYPKMQDIRRSKVISKTEIIIVFKGGYEMRMDVEK